MPSYNSATDSVNLDEDQLSFMRKNGVHYPSVDRSYVGTDQYGPSPAQIKGKSTATKSNVLSDTVSNDKSDNMGSSLLKGASSILGNAASFGLSGIISHVGSNLINKVIDSATSTKSNNTTRPIPEDNRRFANYS